MEETGSVKHKHNTALLIIDMMNTLNFPGGEKLLENARPAAEAILKLKFRLKKQGVPVIYVNDNFGQWQSNWQGVYKICCKSRGKDLARLLNPGPDDYFVLKPKHSGFYSTTLEVLLGALGSRKLILCGIAGNICVLFTANDAHMRDYKVVVPEDCMASLTTEDHEFTVRQLSEVLKISTKPSSKL